MENGQLAKTAVTAGATAAFGPVGGFAVETGITALSGIFQSRAAERARKQQEELTRDQAKLNIEQNKGMLQQQILSGLASNLSNIIMQRAR